MRPSVQIPHVQPALQKHSSSYSTQPACGTAQQRPRRRALQSCAGKNKSSILKGLLRCLGMTRREVRGRKAESIREVCRGSERKAPARGTCAPADAKAEVHRLPVEGARRASQKTPEQSSCRQEPGALPAPRGRSAFAAPFLGWKTHLYSWELTRRLKSTLLPLLLPCDTRPVFLIHRYINTRGIPSFPTLSSSQLS